MKITGEQNSIFFDVACAGILVFSAAIALLWGYDSLPLQFWDESRNANNALEMSLGGNWLVPTYAGLPDHWNTKPPLLIWIIAGLMELGLPPLLAVRLPSALAAMATLLMVWSVVRYGLRDRLAAFIAGVFIISSSYMGLHGARTGDYDVLLALFSTGYVLSFWRALADKDRLQFSWIAITAVLIFLAFMTKGVAGGFALVGLGLFCLASGNLLRILSDWRCWVILATSFSLCAAYYFTRELYDPGYVQAVWNNEMGGRYSETIESHAGSPLFYLRLLFKEFQPGSLAVLLLAVPLLQQDLQRRRLVQATFFSGLGILLLISSAKTQLPWYVIPVIPLWAIAASIATVDIINKFRSRRSTSPTRVRVAVGSILVLSLATALHNNLVTLPAKAHKKESINSYGILFNRLRAEKQMPQQLTILDEGIENTTYDADQAYNPVLKFYSLLELSQGNSIHVLRLSRASDVQGFIASCDRKNISALKRVHLTSILFDDGRCVFGEKNPRVNIQTKVITLL